MKRLFYVFVITTLVVLCGCSTRSKYTVAGKTFRTMAYDPNELELYEIRFDSYNKYGPQKVTYLGKNATYTQEDDLILIRVISNDIACYLKGNKLLVGTDVYVDVDNPSLH